MTPTDAGPEPTPYQMVTTHCPYCLRLRAEGCTHFPLEPQPSPQGPAHRPLALPADRWVDFANGWGYVWQCRRCGQLLRANTAGAQSHIAAHLRRAG